MTLPALPSFEFYHRLSRRERVLLLMVAGAMFFILNLVALRVLITSYRQLTAERRAKAFEAQTVRMYQDEKPRWVERMRWLHDKQPPLTNRNIAGVRLQEQVKTLADKNGVVLSVADILPASTGFGAQPTDYQSVVFKFDAKGDWASTWKFLSALQWPENFVAFESASLRTDPADPNMMKSSFRVAKWYAPLARR